MREVIKRSVLYENKLESTYTRHKQFWLALVAGLLVLANHIFGMFGIDITVISAEITIIVETVLSLLVLLGIVIDPTTNGVSDSGQVMRYEEPWSEKKENNA